MNRASDNEPYATLIVRLDNKSIVYGRLADTLFNALESIGGFYESIRHIGLLAVFFFQERLFKSSFIRQLYQVDPEKVPPKVKVPLPTQMASEIDKHSTVQEPYLKQVLDYFLLRS